MHQERRQREGVEICVGEKPESPPTLIKLGRKKPVIPQNWERNQGRQGNLEWFREKGQLHVPWLESKWGPKHLGEENTSLGKDPRKKRKGN